MADWKKASDEAAAQVKTLSDKVKEAMDKFK